MALLPGGGHAELVVVHESHVLPVPETAGWPEAGGFVEVFATAHDALFTQAELMSGERLLVNGASGGVGIAGVQLGSEAGATVSGDRPPSLRARSSSSVRRTRKPSGKYNVILELVGGDNLRNRRRAAGAQGAYRRDRRRRGRYGRGELPPPDARAGPHPRFDPAQPYAG